MPTDQPLEPRWAMPLFDDLSPAELLAIEHAKQFFRDERAAFEAEYIEMAWAAHYKEKYGLTVIDGVIQTPPIRLFRRHA